MAKAIEKLQVRLEVAGLEDLAKLKGSFRALGQAVAPADAALSDARKAVLDFAASSKQSVQLIEGQIQAFKGLRAQAAAGGGLYRQLTGDIKRLESASYGASEAIEQQRKQLTAVGTSANATVPQIKQAVSALIGLRTETRTDSDAFNKFGQSISAVSSNLRQVTADTQAYSDARKRSTQVMAAESGAAKQQLKDIQLLVQTFRQQRDELGALQGQERIRRGLADLVDKGEVSSGTRTYEDIIASSLFGEFKAITTEVLPAKDIQKAVEEVKSQLRKLQEDIERNIARGLQRSFQETAREARESARAAAQAFSSPEFLAVFNNLTKRLGELPQTAAGFSQRLRELQQVFANTAVSAENYVTIALEIARVQREASAATQGLGAALVRDLDAGVAARSQKNLQEAIGQLKQEMLELDTTTTAGARAYAENANQVRVLERQLKQLAEAYRNVADVAPRAAGAQGGVSPFLPSGARNPNYVSPQQAAAAETQAQLDEELKNLIQESNEHRKREIQTRIENLRAINAENEARREQAAIDRSIRKGQARIAANQPPVQLSALEQNREAVLTQLALQGRELSSFYEGIVNLGTASTRRQQAMMGRTGTEVLTDIFTAFNRGGQAAVNQQESRRVGDSIAEGIAEGASTSSSLDSGAKSLSQRFIAALKQAFRIKSPSGESRDRIGIPIGEGIGEGILLGLKGMRQEVVAAIRLLLAEAKDMPGSVATGSALVRAGSTERPVPAGMAAIPKGYRGLAGRLAAVSSDPVRSLFNITNAGFLNLPTSVTGLRGTALSAALQAAAPSTQAQRGLSPLFQTPGALPITPSFRPYSMGGGTGPSYIPPSPPAPPPPPRPPRTGAGAAPLPPPPEPTAYQRLTKAVEGFGLASDRSTQDLREFLSTLRSTADILDPTAADFAKVNRVIEQQGRLVERELERRQRTTRRFSAGQLAQTAGAALSGAVFGGPEGFLGGVVGGIAGGPGGAFAGAAAGAQVAMLRQAAGGAAEYAAAINQQRRALRGVVDDTAAYQQSLAFIDQTSRQLAIPQEQVTRNFTRLSASVLGAGGNVDAAQEAFMGISSAILGTGGSLADLDAALLATSQVFSKGKVSAEEIRGQIGERLPGAFNLLATAIGKTPAELDKMLEKGEVTLNDFMKFVRLASTDYGKNVVLMSESSEAAGRRLATTFARMQEEIGKALQPIGAQFQDTFAKFLTENEASLVELAKSVAGAAKAFLDFAISAGPALVELGKFALAFGAATLALKAFTAAGPYVVAALRLMGVQFVATSAAVDAAQKRLVAFGGTVKALAASLAAPIVITVLVQGVLEAISNLEKVKRLKQEVEDLPSVEEFIGSRYKNSAIGPEDRQQLIRDLEETNDAVIKQTEVAGKAQIKLRQMTEEAGKLISANKPNAAELLAARAAADTEIAKLNNLIERRKVLGRYMGQIGTGSPEKPFEFATPTPEDGGAKEKKGPKPPEDRTLELRDQLQLLIAVGEWEDRIRDLRFQGRERLALEAELSKELAQIEAERVRSLRDANYEGERAHINAIAQAKQVAARRQSEDAIRALLSQQFQQKLQNRQAVRDAAKPIEDIRKAQEQQLSDAKEYLRLVSEGMLPEEAKRIINFERTVLQQKDILDTQIQITEAAIIEAKGRGAAVSDLEKELALLKQKRDAVVAAAAQGPGRGQTNIERIKGALAATKGELNELTNLGNLVVNSANAIGDAFGQAFQKLVTGAASAKQVLSDFFQSVANAFFEMATQIISKLVVMIALQAVLKALGGASGGGGEGGNMAAVDQYANTSAGFTMDDFPTPAPAKPNAKGNAFSPQGHMEAYAKGGVIKAPTLFRYANGGGGFNTGLMGEAGPEAILPLRRTPDGRLGVTQVRSPQGGDTRMSEMMGRSPAQQQAPTLNLKFETTTINGVEYVSREQLEVAMAQTRRQATNDGAKRGMTMTLDKMRNSPRTRAQVGMR